MPITTFGSYSLVMDQFSDHWADTNTRLGGTSATDLKLEGGFTRAMFITLRNNINDKVTAEQGLENGREIAAANRDLLKNALRERLRSFRGVVTGLLSKTKYFPALPVLPDVDAAESKFLEPFDDADDLWERINADATITGFTPPLTIGPYVRATFTTDIAGARTGYAALTKAENDQTLNLRDRDALLPVAIERMNQYRTMVTALFGLTDPLTTSLPDIYPAPGSTPDPVVLTLNWNAGLPALHLHWTASTATNLQEYEIRRCTGPTWNDATAVVIGNVAPGVLDFQTINGLPATGSVATYKVFVRLTTGNIAGSNAETFTRP